MMPQAFKYITAIILTYVSLVLSDGSIYLVLQYADSESAKFLIYGLEESYLKCQFQYTVQGHSHQLVQQFVPTHGRIVLRELMSNQTYSSIVICYQQDHTSVFSNDIIFKTAPSNTMMGKLQDLSNATQVESQVSSVLSPNTTTGISMVPTSTEGPRYANDSTPLDIALGLVFGLLGMVIIGTAGYYLWKKQRRRLRLRRLLRHPENDPFPDLDDYGSAI